MEIPRFQCAQCNRIHRGLPDTLLTPYKHYAIDVIEAAADSVLTAEDLAENYDSEYPSEKTLKSWQAWIERNILHINSVIKSVGVRILEFTEELLYYEGPLLEKLRAEGYHWLAIADRFIYNSGHSIPR